jgi:hypothetical protein
MTDTHIVFKKLEPVQSTFSKTHINTLEQILPLYDRSQAVCGDQLKLRLSVKRLEVTPP